MPSAAAISEHQQLGACIITWLQAGEGLSGDDLFDPAPRSCQSPAEQPQLHETGCQPRSMACVDQA